MDKDEVEVRDSHAEPHTPELDRELVELGDASLKTRGHSGKLADGGIGRQGF
jgi:hypothetical protein